MPKTIGGREGLVAVQREVHPITGKPFMRTQWIRPQDLQEISRKTGLSQEETLSRLKQAKIVEQPKEGGKGAVKIPSGRTWVDKIPGLPEDTQKANFVGYKSPQEPGVPSPERQQLHDAIKKEVFGGVPSQPEGTKPIAIVMMGATASGKSSLVKGLPKGEYVRIDSDMIKDRLPEFRAAIGVGTKTFPVSAINAAPMTHEESSYLAKQIRAEAVLSRKNFIFDGTGNDLGKYQKFVTDLKGAGYHVQVLMSDLTPEEGMKRAGLRAEQTGRVVDQAFARNSYDMVPRNFEPISGKADEFYLFDNHGKTPRLVWSRDLSGKDTVHDVKYKQEFDRRAKLPKAQAVGGGR